MNWLKQNAPTIGALTSLAIVSLLIGGWLYAFGALQSRVDNVSQDQAEMRQEMREGFDRLDADFKSFETILREEIRMSDKNILSALVAQLL